MRTITKITTGTGVPIFAASVLVLSIVLASCGGGGYGGGGGMGAAPPTGFSLVNPSPADMMMAAGTTPTFAWMPSANASDYRIEVDTTGTFAGPFVINITVGATTYMYMVAPGTLTMGTVYHWRIIAESIYGQAVAGPRTVKS